MTSLRDDQIALPEQLPVPEGALVFWCIWDHPADYPGGYLLRAQLMINGAIHISPVKWHAATPDMLRSILPPGCVNLGHQDGDPPHLLETWLA